MKGEEETGRRGVENRKRITQRRMNENDQHQKEDHD